jgi:hypothetical protein
MFIKLRVYLDKDKGKAALLLKRHVMKMARGCEAPQILNLGTKWK